MTIDLLVIGILLCTAVNIGLIIAVKNLWIKVEKLSLKMEIDSLEKGSELHQSGECDHE